MRKIAFYGAVSLDGYLADEKDELQWLFDTNLAGKSTYEAFEKELDTLVMGRTTYEASKKMVEDGAFYPGKEKIIFSHTLQNGETDETFVSGDVVTILSEFQKKQGQMIWIVGGGGILHPLLEAKKIDEIWLQIAPVLLGRGKRLFEKGNYRYRFELVEVTQMGELTELHLRRKK